jgi:hypothetical protein
MATAKLAQPEARLDLQYGLDFPLPSEVCVGDGTALFVCGWCFSGRGAIGSLALVIDGEEQPVSAHGLPRREVMDGAGGPPERSYRSGFWGFAPIAPGAPGSELRIELLARSAGGAEERVEIARVRRAELEPPLLPGATPRVAICMATHEPPMELFARQIDSIRAQTVADWVCVISDDSSTPERFEAMRQVVGDDPRFQLTRAPSRLGFYGNFERALALAPEGAEYVAMADQDDYWYPDKLSTLLDAIGGARLVYSDARIVDTDGRVTEDTYWSVRRNNHTDLFSLLVANSVTGAASLFPRDLLRHALPFPPAQWAHFHDHWLGLTALSLGDVAYVDRPLYEYTQHGGAVLGHVAATTMPTMGDRVRGLGERGLRDRVGRWRFTYYVDGLRLTQFATILLMRCGAQMAPAKRRALERFLRLDRAPRSLAGLLLRAGRELAGRPTTLGAELGLFFGFGWRHLAAAASRAPGAPGEGLKLDAQPPPRLQVKPAGREIELKVVRDIESKIEPLAISVDRDAPRRVNLLIPTIDLAHFFGGYVGKFNLARRLAERGARVRIITVDHTPPLPRDWRETIESYSGLAGIFDRVEIEFGREAASVEVGPEDAFVASTWWTAHIAHAALQATGGASFLYLIQEYEPFTFRMGSLAALADDSYALPHRAMFSTELLRDFFRRRGLGVYRGGTEQGDAGSVAFQNAITAVEPPTAGELAARSGRSLLFYARPEDHAARNMFELGALALGRAARQGLLDGWELHGIGTTGGKRRVAIGGGAVLELLPRVEQAGYADVLRAHDAGLALMYTPHPSLVPIEMASAGMLTVTNSFENKTAAAMSAISSNLITAPPSIDGVVAGLREAVSAVGDVDRRVRGGRVEWSRSWADSLPDDLMQRVEELLGVGPVRAARPAAAPRA